MHFIHRHLLLSAGIALSLSLHATEPVHRADTVAASQLPDVEVLGRPRTFGEVIPAQRLEGAELERLNAHNVADAIRYFSGVQIKDYGGVGGVKTVDMRSMGSNHMGVFYDGIQLGNAQNGQIDLGKYSLDNVEEISMYNGQKSEIFQSAKDFGSAGAIYIRTRTPRFRGGRRVNANVTMRTGSFGLANPSARVEWKISDAVSASVNAEYTYATGRYKFRYRKVFPDGQVAWDTTAVRRNGDIHAFRAEAALFGRIREGRWYGKVYYYDSERGIPGAIVNNVWKNSQRQWDRNLFAQGSWQKSLSSRNDLMVSGKYARDYMRYLNPDTTLMYLDNRFWQDELYLSAVDRFAILPCWDASVAVDWQWNHLKSDMVNFSRPTRHTLLASLATSLRLQRFRAQASLLGTFVADRATAYSDGVVIEQRRKRYNQLTPAVFLSWQPLERHDLTLRAFYKRVFRMPTFNDLYYTDIGNADLKPEFATQYDLGATYNLLFTETVFRSLQLTLDGYHNRVDDKIIAVPKGTGQYRWMMMNIGKVRITGLDLAAALQMDLPGGVSLDGRLSYTFQQARDFTDPADNLDAAGTYKGQIAYIPKHSGSAVAGALWRDLSLNYSFIYIGERWHNSSNIPVNYEQPWYTHDISIAYLLRLPKVDLKLTLEVNNLFNQQYEVIQNYPMPGRNFKLILQCDI